MAAYPLAMSFPRPDARATDRIMTIEPLARLLLKDDLGPLKLDA